MAIYKHVSSKEIVRKVFRDMKPNNADFIHDAIEWIGEALEHIGASPQLCRKQVAVNSCVSPSVDTQIDTVVNQIETLNSNIVTYSNQLITNTVTGADLNDTRIASNNQLRDLNVNLEVLTNMYFTGGSCLSPLQYGASTFHSSIHCDGCVNENIRYKDTYIIDCDHIKTSFTTGKVCVSYMAFPVDEECYPMVPDDISYREAMFWYIYKKLLLSGTTGRNLKITYEFAEMMWQQYCAQARNAANYPDIDKYESFMNQWVRLVPDINAHNSFFETLNDREQFTADNF